MSYRYRRAHGWSAVIVLLLSVLLTTAQQRGWLPAVGQAAIANQPGGYRIDHFIDGDTIAVDMNGTVETIRMIGVDTPETHKPHTPVQCYGPAAAAYTKQQIGSGTVRLAADPLSTDRDRYGRLLRYVYLQNGQLLEDNLIKNGYGFYYPYFPFSKSDQFAADEKIAQTDHRGLWANCQPTPTDSGGWVSNPQS